MLLIWEIAEILISQYYNIKSKYKDAKLDCKSINLIINY